MKKRILAFCLMAALLLGLLPGPALAEETAPVCEAAFAPSVTVDGQAEADWLLWGTLSGGQAFGALWDGGSVYLAVAPSAGDTALSVQVGAAEAVVTPDGVSGTAGVTAAWGQIVEIGIPLDAAGLTVRDYGVITEAALTVGDSSWNGNLSVSGVQRKALTPEFPVTAEKIGASWTEGEYDFISTEQVENGFTMHLGTSDQTIAQVLRSGAVSGWSTGSGQATVEFDLLIDAMPLWGAARQGDMWPCKGFVFYISNETELITAGITNSADGLLFCLNTDKTSKSESVALHRQVGEPFHLRLDWAADGTLTLYVDGEQLAVVEQAARPLGGWRLAKDTFQFNLFHNTAAAGDMDVTVTNVRVGSSLGASVLELLTFDAIRGSNGAEHAVVTDLQLPETLLHPHFGTLALQWSSSDETVITADGKVTRSDSDKVVTLTAALAAEPAVRKQFVLTVPKLYLEANLAGAAVTLDGTKAEGVWPSETPFAVENGITAGVSALWSKGTAYLAVRHSGAERLKLELGDAVWNISLQNGTADAAGVQTALGEGLAELQIDLAAAGITLSDYGQSRRLQLTLTDQNGGGAVLEHQPVLLIFAGRSLRQLTALKGSVNGFAVDSAVGGWTVNTSDTGRKYNIYQGLSEVDHKKDLLLEQTICVQAMPAGSGVLNGMTGTPGYYFAMSTAAGSNSGQAVLANLYHSGSGLMLRVSQGTMNNGAVVDLGRGLGETFTLGVRWNTDEALQVYVDGTLINEVENATIPNVSSGAAGKQSANFNYKSPAAGESSLTVSGVTLTTVQYERLAHELTPAAVLPAVDLQNVAADFPLPASYSSPWLGEIPLTWAGSSEYLTVSGSVAAVTRPDGRTAAYAPLTLLAYDTALWTTEVRILSTLTVTEQPITLLTVPFADKTVTADGQITEAGWNLNTKVLHDGVSAGKFGAQWDMQNLYLAVKTEENLSLTLNGRAVNMAGAAVSGEITELTVPLSDIGVTVRDYGEEIDASVQLGDTVWNGTLRLSGSSWLATDTTGMQVLHTKNYTNNGVPLTDKQNSVKNPNADDSWYLFDHYDADLDAQPMARVEVNLGGGAVASQQEIYGPLNDLSTANFAEFDVKIENMPIWPIGGNTGISKNFPSYGLTWYLSTSQVEGASESVVFGMFNTDEGLLLVAHDHTARDAVMSQIILGKSVGDRFRMGVRWEPNGDVTVFVDGESRGVLPAVAAERTGWGNLNLCFNLLRNRVSALSSNDNMDVYLGHIAVGKSEGDSLFDGLTFDTIRGENANAYEIGSDLVLPHTLGENRLGLDGTLTWRSSDSAVLAEDGTVTVPAHGVEVTLTASIASGAEKVFRLYVPGTATDGLSVMAVTGDSDTAHGAGVLRDRYRFTLDADNSSVILDQGESKRFRAVTLTDSDDTNRLNESVLTIWVSDDNVTYTRVADDFKLLRAGEKTYLYDFEAEGRYVKVHCTHYDGTEADFTGPLQQMLAVSDETVFGDGGGSFRQETVSVTNAGSTDRYDDVWKLETEAQRVLLDGELLYHYVENGCTYVRVPAVAAGETVSLTVLSGNESAMDIANREYTHEVVYGTREVVSVQKLRRPFAVLPGGVLMTVYGHTEDAFADFEGTDEENARRPHVDYLLSYDGGLSWSDPVKIAESYSGSLQVDGWIHAPTGLYYDETVGEQGRILLTGFYRVSFDQDDETKSNCRQRFMYSDDMGKTWHRCPEVEILGRPAYYSLSYNNPLRLSDADGEGERVDYVMPCGVQYGTGGNMCARILFSCDGGLTWSMSESVITAEGDNLQAYEGGVSEGTVMEKDDGTLVFYGRCQMVTAETFVKSYSRDRGRTWDTTAVPTAVYTTNTQPVQYGFGGSRLLFWSGNNALGCEAQTRYPLNVGVSYDDWETFENIQDLFSCYSLQGMTGTTGFKVTNPDMAHVGDTMTVSWNNHGSNGSLIMRIDDFTDYLFRTKGAYDSFEQTSVKYEGWSVSLGSVTVSEEQASEGSRSMHFGGGSAAVRSVPYVQDGTVSFDLYAADASAVNMTVELEAAYATVYAKAAPVAVKIRGGALNGLALRDGWNKISFALQLTDGKASVTVNGETAELAVNLQAGDYVCWVDLNVTGSEGCYVDAFTVVDARSEPLPEKPAEPEAVEPFGLAGASMTLSNDLSMNFYVSQADVRAMGLYAEILRNGRSTRIPMKDWSVNGSLYQISYKGLAAKEMTEEVTVTIYDANGNAVSNTWTDSIRDYAMRMIQKDSTEAALKTTLVDMLNYGAEAQVFFNYNTDDLANSLLTEEQKAFATESVEMKDIRVKADGYIGSSLELETNILLKFVFDDDYAGETAVVTYVDHYGREHSDEYVLTKNGAYATIAVNTLVVADCSVPVTVTVGEIEVVDSVESYCARMQLELCEPLMKFAASAKAYFK